MVHLYMYLVGKPWYSNSMYKKNHAKLANLSCMYTLKKKI